MSAISCMSSHNGPPISAEQFAGLPPEFRALLQLVIDHYEGRLAALEAELRALQKTPQNSSVPPGSQSSCQAGAEEEGQVEAQMGRAAGTSEVGTTADSGRAVRPCGRSVSRSVSALRQRTERRKPHGGGREPLRHQVWELPEFKPVITEYRRHRGECPCCPAPTCAALPVGVPSGQSGPRLTAFVGLLMACFRQNKRRTTMFLSLILNRSRSTGLAMKLQNIVHRRPPSRRSRTVRAASLATGPQSRRDTDERGGE